MKKMCVCTTLSVVCSVGRQLNGHRVMGRDASVQVCFDFNFAHDIVVTCDTSLEFDNDWNDDKQADEEICETFPNKAGADD